MPQFLQSLRTIRLLLLIVFVTSCLNLSLKAEERVSMQDLQKRITINFDKINLKEALDLVAKKASVVIIYSNSKELINSSVSIHAKHKPVKEILDDLLAKFPLSYRVIDDKIVISHDGSKPKQAAKEKPSTSTDLLVSIKGKVTDEQEQPLPGATVKIKDETTVSITDKDGNFTLNSTTSAGILTVSFIGYQTAEVSYNSDQNELLTIQLKPEINSLNSVQVIGYGTTTKRLNTGSVSTISAADIEKQPVTNILSALTGRLPGIFVQTTNGLPGGNINIQIRGKGSLTAGTNPLYIIDGVPFDSTPVGNGLNNSSGSPVNGVVSPLNSINPADIESISVLKDADATSIYGSRGSNGVVLITTKKGQQGNTKGDINVSSGISRASNFPKLLDLNDYLQIRKEAFANDKLTPTAANGFDLLTWPQDQSMNWGKYLFGNSAHYTDVTGSLSGGSAGTTFRLSSAFHQEGNVISDIANYRRGSLYFSMRHLSADKKLELQISNSLVLDNNSSPDIQNASIGLFLAPNFPLLDPNGLYTVNAGNPLRDLNASTSVKTNNIVSSVSISYALMNDLHIKLNGGYNRTGIDQMQLFPLSSLQSGTNYSLFNQNTVQTFIAEPQLNYIKKVGNGELNILLGGTYEEKNTTFEAIRASNFNNEGLMQDLASAATIDIRANSEIPYKYVSVFGRATYNLSQKYIINATIRRDGSSRFGPGYRFGNFGSVGAAWIFSEETPVKSLLPFISYGKIRSSYGTTGNDQITDYQYLSTYSSQSYTYQGIATQAPSRIANSDFHWETTKKIELAVELGFFRNRLLVTTDYYRNRSSDQLINYSLPSIAGFTSYQANLSAVVQNSGWEFELNTINLQNKSFSWSTTFNLTIPKNKLVSFQNFTSSAYSQTFDIGYDINIIKGDRFLGVDPQTGNAIYADVNGNPTTVASAAYNGYTLGKRTPDFYGGLGNTLKYKQVSLDIFFQFTKQISYGGIRNSLGLPLNNYEFMVDRWQKPGDITNIPKASTISDNNLPHSSAAIFDGSYIRLKNVSLRYDLPQTFVHRIKATQVNIFVRGENVLTFYNKNGAFLDPESGGFFTNGSAAANIPPIKSFVAGIQITF